MNHKHKKLSINDLKEKLDLWKLQINKSTKGLNFIINPF